MEYTIEKKIGAIGEPTNSGWVKELNKVSWNGREAKLDIREWSPEHDKMGKGTTLTESEARRLLALLQEYFAEQERRPDI